MNIYLQKFYPSIGPYEAFDLWWSVFVIENLGKISKVGSKQNFYTSFYYLAYFVMC